MMIHGLSFISLSASVLLPWVLSGSVEGEKITGSLVKDVVQSSTVQKITENKRKLISAIAPATTYYVSANGNDRNSGLSAKDPFKTPQRAANLVDPGDTVLIMNGEYTSSKGSVILQITRSGKSNAWITFKAYPGHSPKFRHNRQGSWGGVLLKNGASYIEINGLEVIGNNYNITRTYALSQKTNRSNSLTNGNCIVADGRNRVTHHIRILNNKVYGCGGGGIAGIQSDYVTVKNNEVFDNAWYSINGNSGISFLNSRNFDNNKNDYRFLVTNNKVYNNKMLVPWIYNNKYQDGNGIIIDNTRNERVSGLGKYTGRTLIANNLTYKNGGSGIHVYKSDNVDIVHNTAYLNNQTPEISSGQIFAHVSGNVKIINNILYAYPGKAMNLNTNKNVNVTYNKNIYGGKPNYINYVGPQDMIADPQFVNPSNNDFRLKPTSPGVNNGYKWSSLTNDFQGNRRPSGSGYDIGAYER